MCGRYSLTSPIDGIRNLFGFDQIPNLPARYNIAPTQAVLIVRPASARADFQAARLAEPGSARSATLVRWGLIPSWAKEASIGSQMINARAETVTEKPSFRTPFRRRRCLIPADSFYEWKTIEGRKQATRISFEDGGVFAFAGLWEDWLGPDGSQVETCSIVTTQAAPAITHIHHRMPVILDPDRFETWLTGAPEAAEKIMGPYKGARRLVTSSISSLVNNVRNDGPDLWKEIDLSEIEPSEVQKGREDDTDPPPQLSLF